MDKLKDRILHDGKCLPGGVLKVDGFINHQMDPQLMMEMAQEIVCRFDGVSIDKVITIEASGIAPAVMTGYLLGVPVLFAKKSVPRTMDGMLSTSVFSFTKQHAYDITVSGEYLCRGDRVLFVDDFLACGNAALGIMDLVDKAGAVLCGMAFLIEKSFQGGRSVLHSKGVRVESLVRISSLDDCRIEFGQ